MTKPKITQEVKINSHSASTNTITFYGTSDALQDFEEFGDVEPDIFKNRYVLFVDPRFNFQEVLAYVQNYNEEVSADE